MDERDLTIVAAAVIGAVFAALVLWRVARQFLLTGLFVVTWLVFYEECKDSYAAKIGLAAARKLLGLVLTKFSAWAAGAGTS